ncbi:unnamed protein product [Nezara viridula]|uniref:Uncharacterized protein n=1 Tax=Nezara viridula TaxID=85310 RepID=A0A9P0H1Y0_NEZVI|nr:unnamed protein product [Nezara viridula]
MKRVSEDGGPRPSGAVGRKM